MIAKCDDHDRTVDVHSFRHTFATLLARKGVLPAVAQKLMRHSDIRLTMNVYTHLDVADTAGAVAGITGLENKVLRKTLRGCWFGKAVADCQRLSRPDAS